MQVTSLVVDAPGQLTVTRLLRDEPGAVSVLRQLYPDLVHDVSDDDVVHHLALDGVRARIERHDISELLAAAGIPPAPYGDLYRIDWWASTHESRRGTYLRPATALEAAMSTSCAALDGGSGVFGVRARRAPTTGDTDPQTPESAGPEFLHYDSPAWQQALTSGSVRYHRVENIPSTAVLPSIKDGETELRQE